MSMTRKQAMREARQLFRLCFVNGRLDEGRVLKVVQSVIQCRRRGYLALLGYFRRLVKLDCAQHTAKVESAEPVAEDLRTHIQADLERAYGPGLATRFVLNPELIGGMRVQVGSDVYDRSVQAGIAELKKRFGIISTNGRTPQI
ncbi:F0F1 ATP synthase subunit delta [Edaphobacter aggregans]|uniref:F0F1 ATP synthase subunit delta n=1 Tax=Edaphobacter aggregans TaxID=570835 RepID=UPI00054D2D9E|nr:F0F1 ATP synthase subunit delta [Edaphobacter aggregans]